jgi:hypothetical protein
LARSSDLEALRGCVDLLSELRKCVKVLPGARITFTSESCEDTLDKFRECVVHSYISSAEVEKARRYVETLRQLVDEVSALIGARGWLLPREAGDFAKNPVEHLKKKLTLYTYDLLRRRINIEEYASKARAALGSSMRSNLRIIYEVYVLVAIVYHLSKKGAKLVYPEHRFIHFDRHGKQVSGTVPPNLVINVDGRGALSFFLEAPRPLGWRDFKDLQQVWRFYITLRPDIMVYSGVVLDIVDLSSPDIPIKRPDVIIECKELEDWFIRRRELKGPVSPSISFNEWFKRWLSGLWTGLADVLGVDSSIVKEVAEGRRRGVWVTETQLIKLYNAIYKPRSFYLVSSPRLPAHVVNELESSGVKVYDGVVVGDLKALEGVSEEILKYARPPPEDYESTLLVELTKQLRERGLEVRREDLVQALLEFALSRVEDLASYLKARRALADASP